MRHVSIEGIIGCGKTTLLDQLEARGFRVIREDIREWTELLNLFYQDQKRWALTLQTKIFMHFSDRRHQTDGGQGEDVCVWERSHVSNVDIFYELLCQMRAVNAVEKGVFMALCKSLRWTPDNIVYLRLNPDTAMERVCSRNGKEDQGVTVEYQRQLHERHELVMDAVGAHQVDASLDPEALVEEVVKHLRGLA